MEMFQKLKARLAEEPDSESEREAAATAARATAAASGAGGGERRTPEEMAKEVAELKDHINKNYFVYVKRLEKRKERIKELEEYAKLLIKDNEALQAKQKEFDGCQKQLGEYREQLEQLEGFQSQELSKVKHMLLSAESALEQERRGRKQAEERGSHGEEAEQLRTKVDSLTVREKGCGFRSSLAQNRILVCSQGQLVAAQSREKEAGRSHEETVKRLEERLKQQDMSGDDRVKALTEEVGALSFFIKQSKNVVGANQRDALDDSLKESARKLAELEGSHEKTSQEQRDRLASLELSASSAVRQRDAAAAERDALRTQLLEAEIAAHEAHTGATGELEGARAEAKRLAAAKDRLEEALRKKEAELSSKNEESKQEAVRKNGPAKKGGA